MQRLRAAGLNRGFVSEFMRIALPTVVANIVSSSLHIVDTVMIGQLGDIPLAAVFMANQYQFVLRLFVFGIASGAAIYAAQFWGSRDEDGVRRSLVLAWMGSAAVALPFFIGAATAPGAIMRLLMPNDPQAAVIGAEYMRYVSPTYLFLTVTLNLASVNRSSERARLAMTASVIAILTNTFLNWVLIYGSLGAPRMGAKGAAIATSIAAGLETAIVIAVTWGRKYPAAARFDNVRRITRGFARDFFRTCWPVMLNEGLWAMGVSMYNMTYARMGTVNAAAMSIFGNAEQLMFGLVFGFVNAAGVMVGKRIGAGEEEDAYGTARIFLYVSTALMLIVGLAAVLPLRGPLLSVFNVSASAKTLAGQVLTVFGFLLWAKTFNAVNVVGVLRAGGDTRFTMLLDVFGVWAVGVPMALLGGLVLGLPLPVVYFMTQLEEVLKWAVGYKRFRSRRWINNLVNDK